MEWSERSALVRWSVYIVAFLAVGGVIGAISRANENKEVQACVDKAVAKGTDEDDARTFCKAAVEEGSSEAVTEPTEEATTAPPAPSHSDLQALFAAQVEASEWWPTISAMGFDSTTVVDWGEGICKRFRNGDSKTDINLDIITRFPDEDEKQEALASVVGTAVPALCPEFTDQVSG